MESKLQELSRLGMKVNLTSSLLFVIIKMRKLKRRLKMKDKKRWMKESKAWKKRKKNQLESQVPKDNKLRSQNQLNQLLKARIQKEKLMHHLKEDSLR
jgi:hypothetical protein